MLVLNQQDLEKNYTYGLRVVQHEADVWGKKTQTKEIEVEAAEALNGHSFGFEAKYM